MTALMLAAVRGDESLAKILIDAGASLNAETPVYQIANQNITPETLYWTALTYSSINGHVGIARMLLDRGAHQEGGAKVGEDRCTETPLQVSFISFQTSHQNMDTQRIKSWYLLGRIWSNPKDNQGLFVASTTRYKQFKFWCSNIG